MNLPTSPAPQEKEPEKPSRPLVSRGRATFVHISLWLFAVALIARAVQVQLIDGAYWAERANRQHFAERTLPAARGLILDERGEVLVESRELVQLRIAPREVRRVRGKRDDGPQLARGLAALGVPRPLIRASLDTTRKWVEIPRLFVPRDAQPVIALRHGIYPQFAMQRIVSAPIGVKRLMGTIDAQGRAVGGIEQELDSLLQGQRGTIAGLRDGRGNIWNSPSVSGVDARAGHSVMLTINSTLQEICERELALALARTGASGGDVVVIDPRDGSVLALAGSRGRQPALISTPLAEAYEPGSVLKPFFVARLMDAGVITANDTVNTENGTYTINKRTITDEHKAPTMSVHDIIRFSSNVGIVKLVSPMTPFSEFELLRDFGFGTLTGVPYPAESRGRVPLPRQWSLQTPASLAMGYELLVTPLQLAVAYASLANGGELLQPALIREIRDADGTTLYQHQRRALRRVLSPRAAEAMRVILESVVDSGTATAAELKTFNVAGKSGTARRSENGRYSFTKYNATFAGMFPARNPQYVIVARLIDPQGKIYGGLVAAPLVNRILQGAVASRDVKLDRAALANAARPIPVPAETIAVAIAGDPALAPVAGRNVESPLDSNATADGVLDSLMRIAPVVLPSVPAPSRIVVTRPFARDSITAFSSEERAIPSVFGLDQRDAIRALHASGFHVRLLTGQSGKTRPVAGTFARQGTTVILETAR